MFLTEAVILTVLSATALNPPVEDQRLDPHLYREGLRRRGLTELLQLTLESTPPNNALQSLILNREIKLGEARAPSSLIEQKRQALKDANEILRQIIDKAGDDVRLWDWQLELARSLLYEEAEPHCVAILYRGGSTEDIKAVHDLMAEAVSRFKELEAALTAELTRLDNLPLAEFERLESKGHLDRIENLYSQTLYDKRWATYYRALASRDTDQPWVQWLSRMFQELTDESELLTLDHSVTKHQVQSLLLAGTTSRLLGNTASALSYLEQALEIASDQTESSERRRLLWATNLARLERIRALRDGGNHDGARRAIDAWERELPARSDEVFALRLTLALEARAVELHRADRLAMQGKGDQARRVRDEAWKPLLQLANQDEGWRSEVYAAVSKRLDPSAEISTLSLFEKAALIAELLSQASNPSDGQASATLDAKLDRVIGIAEPIWRRKAPQDSYLHGEIGYNLAVAHSRRGHFGDAARIFLDVARRYPDHRLAKSATDLAIRIASQVRQEADTAPQAEATELYRDALEFMEDHYADSAGAAHWRFFLGQSLLDRGNLDEAAEVLAKVKDDHEYYPQALLLRCEALARMLNEFALANSDLPEVIQQKAATIRTSLATFHEVMEERDVSSAEDAARLLAEAALTDAEITLIANPDRVHDVQRQLDSLASQVASSQISSSRFLAIRLHALAVAGETENMVPLLDAYTAADPAGAGATLQALHDRMMEISDHALAANQKERAEHFSGAALIVAQKLVIWAESRSEPEVRRALYPLRLQQGEAALSAGQADVALETFKRCLAQDPKRTADGTTRDLRLIFDMGRASYGVEQYDEALMWFDRIFRESQDRSETWWRALLLNLDCRNRLGHDPDGILRSIQQQRFLHPEMGGEALREQFAELERDVRARQGPS